MVRLTRVLSVGILILLPLMTMTPATSSAGGLGIPTSQAGLGFGNLKNFTGVRFNLVDHGVHRVGGLNVTLWIPKDNDFAVYQGISLGLVGHQADVTQGVAAALIGLAGGDYQGIALGGIGIGADNILHRDQRGAARQCR